MKTIKTLCDSLEKKIEATYTTSLAPDEAEKLAAEFLHAQMTLSEELRVVELDARMKKSGLKAVQAAVYMAETQGKDKKPTEAALQHTINMDISVSGAQDALDLAEVDKNDLERCYEIFNNAHIFYRTLAKGKFE
jgi:hypothetical protein